jgi:predicted RNA-binding Zn ribbon-like protein
MITNRSRAATLPLIGGRPVLDLVNTVSWRGDPARAKDNLQRPDEALTWAHRAGVLSPSEVPVLRAHLVLHPGAGADLLSGLCHLRSLVADAVLAPAQPRTQSLEPVLLEALAHSHLRPGQKASEATSKHSAGAHRWQVTGLDEHTLARRLALDLLDLLTTSHGRLGQCADPACCWVFLDNSRAQNRQWCSSSDCGNRHRVRQHQRRETAAPARPRAGKSRKGDQK